MKLEVEVPIALDSKIHAKFNWITLDDDGTMYLWIEKPNYNKAGYWDSHGAGNKFLEAFKLTGPNETKYENKNAENSIRPIHWTKNKLDKILEE